MRESSTKHKRIVIDGPTDSYGRTPYTLLWCGPYPRPGHPDPELSRCSECGGYQHGQCFRAPLPVDVPVDEQS